MTDPRIVTPQEAQASLPAASTRGPVNWEHRLVHTVATEPDRTRAAVASLGGHHPSNLIEALHAAAGREKNEETATALAELADAIYRAIEDGVPL